MSTFSNKPIISRKKMDLKDRVTIYEVAKVAGVSLATVSRVINNQENVTEKTKVRVLETIEKLGFRPSSIARSLATSKSTNIGIMLPASGYMYISNMLDGMIDTAKIYGYITSLFVTKRTKEDAKNMIELLIRSHVDGAVIYDDELGTDEIMTIQNYHIPLVIIGHKMENESLGSIEIQFNEPILDVIKEHLSKGKDDIKIIDILNQGRIMDEIRDSIVKYGKNNNKNIELLSFNDSYSLVYEGMKEYFKTNRSGFFVCPRDSLAAAVVNAACESGLNVPNDVQVLAEVGSKYSYIFRPEISSFSVDMFKVGSMAMRMLTKLLNPNEAPSEKSIKIKALYNKRQTTK